VLLVHPRHETRDVFEGHEGDVKGITKAYKTGGLDRGVDIQYPCFDVGLVRDDTDHVAVEPRKPDYDVRGKSRVHLHEGAAVHHILDHPQHVIGLVAVRRDDGVQALLSTDGAVLRLNKGRILQVVLRKVTQELAHHVQRCLFIVGRKVRHPTLGSMHASPAQLLERDFFVGDGLDDLGPGNEHVAGVLHHKDKVRQRGRVHGSAGARPHDDRDLRDQSRSQGVPQEDVPIPGEGHDSFLNTRPSRIIQADHRRTHLHGHIQDLDDLGSMGLAQGTTHHRSVLRIDVDQPTADGAVSGHHAVSQRDSFLQTKIVAAMRHERIDLLEGTLVEQELEPFASGLLAFFVLCFDRCLATTQFGLGLQLAQPLHLALRSHNTSPYLPVFQFSRTTCASPRI